MRNLRQFACAADITYESHIDAFVIICLDLKG